MRPAHKRKLTKLTHHAVRYRKAHGNAIKRCGNCIMFVRTTAKCRLVAEPVHKNGVCDRFSPRENNDGQADG